MLKRGQKTRYYFFPGSLTVSDELYLHIIYGITFNFDNGLIRIDWEHKTEDCIISPDNQDPETMTMGAIYNFQLECDWIGCSHRGTNKVKPPKSTVKISNPYFSHFEPRHENTISSISMMHELKFTG